MKTLLQQLGRAWLFAVSVSMSVQAANTFTNTGSLANGRQAHTATLLYNGKVLVAGGHVGFNPVGSAELYDPATGVWSATGALGTARYAHTATLLPNGKVLVVGGTDSSGNPVGTAELYDPSTGTWTATGSLAAARTFHTATLLANGKVLVVGGGDSGGPIGTSELYDPATGTWSATGSLAVARQNHTATLLPNGRVLAAGGADGFGTFFTSAQLYDPVTGVWSATGALTGARAFHTASLLASGKVLVAGGQTSGFGGLTSAQLYDPATGAWTGVGVLATARYGHTATLLPNGKLLVAGGQTTGGGFVASAELFDSSSGMWSATGALVTARTSHTATVLPKGEVLVAGGVTTGNSSVATAELYDSAYGYWRATGSLPRPRISHVATLLPSGKVLVAGGFYNDNFDRHVLASADLYDSASGGWSATGTLTTTRSDHTATLLSNGKVLVVGGYDGNNYLASAELYDPASGAWSATGPLATARSSHTATLLPDGKVLVAGGSYYDVSSHYLATAELYDPATGAWSATGTLATARSTHTATLLPTGKVLVSGGFGSGELASAELYDPVSGSWTTTGALAAGRRSHTATLLPNGKVLLAGGYPNQGGELYDPATGAWSGTGTTARYDHSATLLPNGKVLVAGGYSGGFFGSAELYDPATGLWTATELLAAPRWSHKATLLPDGKVLVTGGYYYDGDEHYDASAELFDVGLNFAGAWQPQISSALFDGAGRLELKGGGFRGISGSSGSNGSQDSPTNHPVVQWQRLDNEQSAFLLSDSSISVSVSGFTSIPVSGLTPGYALVRVFANGIPSAAFMVLLGFPSIAVELPGGTAIADGGTHSFASVLGTPARLIFTIRNRGGVNLTGLTTTKDGANAADFTLTASPTAPVLPGGSTTFRIQFASASAGTKTAALHIANNVAGFQPYDINLTANPLPLSFTQDADGDGMSDAAEVQLAAQGFDWQVSQPGLVATYYANANDAGLFTTNQVQALNVGAPLIQRDPATGIFKLSIGVKKTTNLLLPFTDFPMNAPGTDTFINSAGKLEFEFTVPDNAAFFRLEAAK